MLTGSGRDFSVAEHEEDFHWDLIGNAISKSRGGQMHFGSELRDIITKLKRFWEGTYNWLCFYPVRNEFAVISLSLE